MEVFISHELAYINRGENGLAACVPVHFSIGKGLSEAKMSCLSYVILCPYNLSTDFEGVYI